jgi:hypothetical protein
MSTQPYPFPPRTGYVGIDAFQEIVALVRDRLGLDYDTTYHNVLADNADLLETPPDAINHGVPYFRLLNRVQSSTKKSATASTYWADDKITKLTNRYFPSLRGAPVDLQWDVIERTAAQLEKCGIAQRLLNRASGPGPEVSKTDWKAALGQADDYLDMLDYQAAASKDIGTYASFVNSGPAAKLRCFGIQIDRLMKDEGLSNHAAFAKLRDTQPIFWAASLLAYRQERQ